MFVKKGAMFGLDARIALAIFGALSLISGAALYSAVQESKATALIVQAKQVSDALTSYRLDVGEDVQEDNTGTLYTARIGYLINNEKNLPGWAGPYISYTSSARSQLDTPNYGEIYLRYIDKDARKGKAQLSNMAGCSEVAKTDGCRLFIMFKEVDVSTINAIEEKLDTDFSYRRGRVQMYQSSNSTSTPDTSRTASLLYEYDIPLNWN